MRRSGALSMVTCVLCSALAAGCLERPGTTVGPEIGFGQEVSIGGGGVSVEYRVNESVSISVGFDYQVLLISAAEASANFFSAGLGFSFGALPDYSLPEEEPQSTE